MAESCTCSCSCGRDASEILIFPCSGASNVGQIANQAGVELTKAVVGKMFCLAGIGAHVGSFVESAKGAKRIVAIDGCPVQCAKKTLEHAGVTITDYVVVTEEGIDKNRNLNLAAEDVNKICTKIRASLGIS
ncbi:putative metal-binding protein [Desulfohalotomaculum tongense]|uniref:putative zinc-binding protein n=1 Tax=Desulforadius tongensis TaxID=1216062 RepID=UPI00195A2E04|nr:putative zinc-binding protein [Desulforadius tongensis]MBM7855855.1 putative metal-binding protein [Desulforadius tongensis]